MSDKNHSTKSISIDAELHHKLKGLSIVTGSTISKMANKFIKKGLDDLLTIGVVTIDIKDILRRSYEPSPEQKSDGRPNPFDGMEKATADGSPVTECYIVPDDNGYYPDAEIVRTPARIFDPAGMASDTANSPASDDYKNIYADLED